MEEYKGSNILFTSSHLFLFSSLFGFYIKNLKVSIGMMIVYLTSIYYHYGGGEKKKILDMTSNIILGLYYSYGFYRRGNYLPGIIGMIVMSLYMGMNKIEDFGENHEMILVRCLNSQPNHSYSMCTAPVEMNHFIFVHIPIYLGFMYIHYEHLLSIL